VGCLLKVWTVDIETERTDIVLDLTEALRRKCCEQNEVGSSKLKLVIEVVDG